MKPYQLRVIDELAELEDKLEKLDNFITRTVEGVEPVTTEGAEPVEIADMTSQSDAMSWYARILRRRIGRF